MSRRHNSAEQEFGSDSFLDIIANIVGILIILIVVAGVKVARQPPEANPAPLPVVAESAGDSAVGFQSADGESGPTEASDDDESWLVLPAVAAEPQLPQIDPQEVERLNSQIADLHLKVDGAVSTIAVSSAELQRLLDEIQAADAESFARAVRLKEIDSERDVAAERVLQLSQSLGRNEHEVAALGQKLFASQQHQQFIADRLHAVSVQTQKLREVLEATPAVIDSGERLLHRLAPVGEPVTEHELHFRISQGHIAHIPLEALLDRLKAQVSSRRSTVMRMDRYEGTVGPVGGFRMDYTVEKNALPPLESLQYGGGAYRVSVSRWTVVPADTLDAEPLDRAVVIGSRFRQVLETAPLDSTITIWLYPDDFAAFRQIRELAHGLNLRVAARPLPPGTPIAGSPSGSRSSGQ